MDANGPEKQNDRVDEADRNRRKTGDGRSLHRGMRRGSLLSSRAAQKAR